VIITVFERRVIVEETFAAGSKNGKLATIINQCTDKRYCGKMCRLLHAM